jgi:uncharacterized membrane protein
MASALSVFEGDQTLSFQERALSVVIGLGLAAAGAKPRPNPLLNVLALGLGSYVAWRGYVGQCPVKAALTHPGSGAKQVAGRADPAGDPSI